MSEVVKFSVGNYVKLVKAPVEEGHLVGRYFNIKKVYADMDVPLYVIHDDKTGYDYRFSADCFVLAMAEHIRFEQEVVDKSTGAIKSDGGSSEYYQIDIPDGMLERWTKTKKIEAKDVMKLFLNNDYNFSNSFKAHARVVSLRRGKGKDGITERYDLKKAVFFATDALSDYDENIKKD